MNVKRNILVFASVSIFIISYPFHVHADKCDDVVNQAKQIFEDAKAASEQKEHEKAAQLFEEAGQHFTTASTLKDGRCPDIADTVKGNADICTENAATSRKSFEERRIVNTYNHAVTKFNEGNSHAQNKKWKLALGAFEEAEESWRSIASTETENGKKALEAADQARKSAELARQSMSK